MAMDKSSTQPRSLSRPGSQVEMSTQGEDGTAKTEKTVGATEHAWSSDDQPDRPVPQQASPTRPASERLAIIRRAQAARGGGQALPSSVRLMAGGVEDKPSSPARPASVRLNRIKQAHEQQQQQGRPTSERFGRARSNKGIGARPASERITRGKQAGSASSATPSKRSGSNAEQEQCGSDENTPNAPDPGQARHAWGSKPAPTPTKRRGLGLGKRGNLNASGSGSCSSSVASNVGMRRRDSGSSQQSAPFMASGRKARGHQQRVPVSPRSKARTPAAKEKKRGTGSGGKRRGQKQRQPHLETTGSTPAKASNPTIDPDAAAGLICDHCDAVAAMVELAKRETALVGLVEARDKRTKEALIRYVSGTQSLFDEQMGILRGLRLSLQQAAG
ncbi:unnamed protein product [Chrysoparadoxa australica]